MCGRRLPDPSAVRRHLLLGLDRRITGVYQLPIANGATIMLTASTMMVITITARAITSAVSLDAVITLAVAAMAAASDLPGRG